MQEPKTELCSLEIKGQQATITLQRMDVFNALSIQMITEICGLLDWTRANSVPEGGNLRVLHIRGKGKHFCAGADIQMMRDAGSKSPSENREDSARLDRLFHGL